MRVLRWGAGVAVAAVVAGWGLTRPVTLPDDAMAGLAGDAARGAAVFWAGGCASCHVAPDAAASEQPVLVGGQAFPSDFGTFRAPNISSDPMHGIGSWTPVQLANAMIHGVSPGGAHYYPAFPYTAYQHVTLQDVADLHAFMMTLPADATPSPAHEVGFPFNIRRAIGGWKLLFLNEDYVLADAATPQIERGRYLTEGLGHCAECHTPRNALGALDRDQWMTGAPNPSGPGRIPAIDPANLTWTEPDIAYYLETGFTPDFDSAGGHMARVVGNFARLTPEDRAAVAAYLKALP